MTAEYFPNRPPRIRRPVLARHARYRWDKVREQHQIVFSEGILVLNESGAAIVARCDGRSREALLNDLSEAYSESTSSSDGTAEGTQSNDHLAEDVDAFLDQLAGKGIVIDGDSSSE